VYYQAFQAPLAAMSAAAPAAPAPAGGADDAPGFTVPPAAVAHYAARGWVVLRGVVPPAEVARIRAVADDVLAGRLDARANRADLGGFRDRVVPAVENIVQIAWPTDLTSALDENLLISRGRAISEQLYGDAPGTWALDMNQFLIKAGGTLSDTPLHQDQSYYIELADARACNIWLALTDVTADMGALAFEDSPLAAPAPLRPHAPAGRGGGALECGPPGAAAPPAPRAHLATLAVCELAAGDVTVHSHLTPHWAAGNSTGAPRYGYVVQTRPVGAVREARTRGFDHGRAANVPRAPLLAAAPAPAPADARA